MATVTTDPTRERIIDAAEECFTRYGVAKTTVEDIAAAAGLSRATVYRSVTGGREELILAVMLRDLNRFLDRLAERLSTQPSVPDAVVEGILDAVRFVKAQPHIVQLLTPEAAGHTQAVLAGAAESILDLCRDYVRPAFDLGQREGKLRPEIDVEGTIEFLFRIISSMIVMSRDRDDESTREFLRTYVVPVIAVS